VYVKANNVVQLEGNLWTEVVINTAELGTKVGSLLDASLDEGLGVIVEHPKAVGWEIADCFKWSVKDHVTVGRKHVRFGVIEFSNLGKKVEMLERGSARFLGPVKMCITQKP
jgi:hypothetical protein